VLNLHATEFLICTVGKSAIVTTPSGLRIACLGGEHQPMAYATSEAALVRSAHPILLGHALSHDLGLCFAILQPTDRGKAALKRVVELIHVVEIEELHITLRHRL
jgi:hypothetical protein